LRLVLVGGVGLIATTVVSSTVTSAGTTGLHLGAAVKVLGIAVPIVLNVLLFTVIFRWLTIRQVTFGDVLPGAALAAVALAILQVAASAFIAHKLKGAKATYGSFGTVIVLLSWFYLQSQVLLLAAQVNIVKQDRLWPRSISEEPEPEAASGTTGEPAESHRQLPVSDQEHHAPPATSSRDALPVAGALSLGFWLGRRRRRQGS
jgi:membrane protein